MNRGTGWVISHFIFSKDFVIASVNQHRLVTCDVKIGWFLVAIKAETFYEENSIPYLPTLLGSSNFDDAVWGVLVSNFFLMSPQFAYGCILTTPHRFRTKRRQKWRKCPIISPLMKFPNWYLSPRKNWSGGTNSFCINHSDLLLYKSLPRNCNNYWQVNLWAIPIYHLLVREFAQYDTGREGIKPKYFIECFAPLSVTRGISTTRA